MHESQSQIAIETREAPGVVERQEAALKRPLEALVKRLKARPPQLAVTCARGSSAHAAIFAKHSIERHLRIPVADAAPSIVTVYRTPLKLKGQLHLTISQSGRSHDLIEQTRAAQKAGALTVGLINDVASPLADMCDVVLPLGAGPELSVAATKTFIATLAAILRLTAAWGGQSELKHALVRLPDRLERASALDWSASFGALADARSMMTIGRGPTLAIAAEAALKLKETCGLHAEAFSGSEFLHGPVSLVSKGFPILMLMPSDQAAGALRRLEADLRRKGASVFATVHGKPSKGRLPALASGHSETDAICLIQSFYAMLGRLARLRGSDADKPRHLQKVTRTR
jgi:glucosamine--fructose-6-phosphate aminotransferase (isomerizing)